MGWLVQAGHRTDDPAAEALPFVLPQDKPRTTARFMHTPLHPLMEAHLEYHRLRARIATAHAA